jgi:hypothetical protein
MASPSLFGRLQTSAQKAAAQKWLPRVQGNELMPRFLRVARLIELTSPFPKAIAKAATGKHLQVMEEIMYTTSTDCSLWLGRSQEVLQMSNRHVHDICSSVRPVDKRPNVRP